MIIVIVIITTIIINIITLLIFIVTVPIYLKWQNEMLKRFLNCSHQKFFIRKKARNLNEKQQKKFFKNFLNFLKKFYFYNWKQVLVWLFSEPDYFLFRKWLITWWTRNISASVKPATLTDAVVSTPSKKSVDTLKISASSTTYCVDGTDIPISHAFTLARVIPNSFEREACVNPRCSLNILILSATIPSPL